MAKSGSSSSYSGGTSIAGLLGVAFVVLKLTGVITWSWWWVTVPFWGGLALVLGIITVGFVLAGGAFSVAALLDVRSRRIARKSRERKRLGR